MSTESEMAAQTEVKEIPIKRQSTAESHPKKVTNIEFMKKLVKVVLLLSLFVYLKIFYLKDFNTMMIMERIKIHRETGSSLSEPEVVEIVRNYSLDPISNPLRRTFFHFERHQDQYVKYWKRNVG